MVADLGFVPVFMALMVVVVVKSSQHCHRLLKCHLDQGVLQLGLQLQFPQIGPQWCLVYLFVYFVEFVIQNVVVGLLVRF